MVVVYRTSRLKYNFPGYKSEVIMTRPPPLSWFSCKCIIFICIINIIIADGEK